MAYASLFGTALAYGLFFWFASRGDLTGFTSLTFLTLCLPLVVAWCCWVSSSNLAVAWCGAGAGLGAVDQSPR